MAKKDKKRPAAFLFNITGRRLAIVLGILLVTGTAALLISKLNKTTINRVETPAVRVATISKTGSSKTFTKADEIPTNTASLGTDKLNQTENTKANPDNGTRSSSISIDNVLGPDVNSISKSVNSKLIDIDANITGNTATGTFRMNINNLGCDTYLLKFSAVGK